MAKSEIIKEVGVAEEDSSRPSVHRQNRPEVAKVGINPRIVYGFLLCE
jgi:hypothetical protein